jgi:hypothetical protein
MKNLRNVSFWQGVIILLVTIYVSIATYYRWFNLRFQIGPFYFTHWLSWIGTLFIAVFTPVYYVLKRRRPKLLPKLVLIHMFGNLLSFMLISIHYAQQVGRPPRFYPDLGTGLALYLTTAILVISGFLHRSQILVSSIPHQNKFIHISLTSAFYLVIVIHILQGLHIL